MQFQNKKNHHLKNLLNTYHNFLQLDQLQKSKVVKEK